VTLADDFNEPFSTPVGRRYQADVDGFRWFGLPSVFTIGLAFDQQSASVRFSIGQNEVWPPSPGIAIDRAAFLVFFGENWNSLWLEGFPENIEASSVMKWSAAAGNLGRFKPSGRLQAEWAAFKIRHCLSDIVLSGHPHQYPELWFVRSDDEMLVDIPEIGVRARVPVGVVMNAIERACNVLAASCAQPTADDSLSRSVKAWWGRNAADSNKLVRLFTGFDDDELVAELARETTAQTAYELLAHQSEVLAAARMRPGGMSARVMKEMLRAIDPIKKHETAELDRLTAKALGFLEDLEASEPPFVQGADLAHWLRHELNLGPKDLINPVDMLSVWGVKNANIRLRTGAVDALAVWGPKRGPAVLVNLDGRHARGYAGRRATIAHEICHLLVDRGRQLPLAEVLGGRAPEAVEQRARAFAAELLLPQRVIYESFLQTDRSVHEVSGLLQKCGRDFRVSKLIAAYQLKNGIRRFHPTASDVRSIVSYVDSITSLDWLESDGSTMRGPEKF